MVLSPPEAAVEPASADVDSSVPPWAPQPARAATMTKENANVRTAFNAFFAFMYPS